jgi:aminopeptidase
MKLREQIFKLVRINEKDPIKARENHIKNLNSYSKYLNEKKFKKLHYRSKKTDLTIELPKNHQRLSA